MVLLTGWRSTGSAAHGAGEMAGRRAATRAVLTRLDAGIACAASALVWSSPNLARPRAAGAAAAGHRSNGDWLAAYPRLEAAQLRPKSCPTPTMRRPRTWRALAWHRVPLRLLRSCPVSLVLVALTLFASLAAQDPRSGRSRATLGLRCGTGDFVAKVAVISWSTALLWEYWPVLVAGAAMGASSCCAGAWHSRPWRCGVAGPGPNSRVLEMEHGMQSVQEMDGIAQRTRLVGVALNAALPPDTVIATGSRMAYFLPGLRSSISGTQRSGGVAFACPWDSHARACQQASRDYWWHAG